MDDSGASKELATAVEVVPLRAQFAGFGHGVGSGIALTLIAVHLWLALQLGDMRAMYRDFGGAIPATTRFVISSGWLWGVPAVGFVLVSVLIGRRPRSLAVHFGLAIVLVVTAVATYYFAQAPLNALAGNIK